MTGDGHLKVHLAIGVIGLRMCGMMCRHGKECRQAVHGKECQQAVPHMLDVPY